MATKAEATPGAEAALQDGAVAGKKAAPKPQPFTQADAEAMKHGFEAQLAGVRKDFGGQLAAERSLRTTAEAKVQAWEEFPDDDGKREKAMVTREAEVLARSSQDAATQRVLAARMDYWALKYPGLPPSVLQPATSELEMENAALRWANENTRTTAAAPGGAEELDESRPAHEVLATPGPAGAGPSNSAELNERLAKFANSDNADPNSDEAKALLREVGKG